ncbi:MAG: glycosyltransferase family 2 protein [Verrucomicrobia bacterium]|nr:glycosyltransferase family 2 protein [Verrucomicrobiota bacterium]
MPANSICLNMIVKNESKVIRRCLSSVKKWIDHWVIVDTGSTDGTQNMIREFLSDIPGELHERPWVDFAHNRNEALRLAQGKSDYLLLIDADDFLDVPETYSLPELNYDLYFVSRSTKDKAPLFIKHCPEFYFSGVLYEVLSWESNKDAALLTDIVVRCGKDGSRSKDPNKHAKDAAILKKALETDSSNERLLFYLAYATLRTGFYKEALDHFEKRASMGGSSEEVFFSLFSSATLQNTLQMPPKTFIDTYCRAYLSRPSRIEPLCELTGYFLQTKQHLLGYLLSKEAIAANLPRGDLFLNESVYLWEAHYQFFLCALEIGRREEAFAALEKLRANPHLPDEYRSQIERKAKFTTETRRTQR